MTADIEPVSSPPERKKSSWVGRIVLAVVVLAITGYGLFIGQKRMQQLHEARELAAPSHEAHVVHTMRAKAGSQSVEVTLPGSVRASETTTMFSRVSGYVHEAITLDIGSHIKKGQVIATVDTPDIDAQLATAKVRVQEAEQNVPLSLSALERVKRLQADNVAAPSAVEAAQVAYNSARALVESTKSEVARIETLKGYQHIVAPLDAVITRRALDSGAYVVAGVTPLFDIAASGGPGEVTVDVPQYLVGGVEVGTTALVTPRSATFAPVNARVVRMASALDPALRTMRTELELPGETHIPPGVYVEVQFRVARKDPPTLIPAMALSVGAAGNRVLSLEAGHAHWHVVTITRDLGKELEVGSSVHPGDELVLYPPLDVAEGEALRGEAVDVPTAPNAAH